MALAVYNTLSRRKEPFEPLEPGRVGMYVCGPTVYDHPHLGHARAAVAFDVIRRSFEFLGYRVMYVRNVTDVDDKIIARATEEGRTPWEVAEEYTRVYNEQMAALGVRPPNVAPRATGHIQDMIKLIEELVSSGHAYAVEGGDVYFSVASFPSYGALSNRSLEDVRARERVEPDPRKRNPLDFALWKGAKPGEPSWSSPWGEGRPGWHIECSAMSSKYLGPTFDIHGGGQDLIFPHHENEIAQSEAATGVPFARVWLHNGFVTIDQEKMAKSLKNFVTVKDVLADYPAPAVRTLLAGAQYRSPIDFSPQALDDGRATWDRLATFGRNAASALTGHSAEPVDAPAEPWRSKFTAAIEDDFNTPEALAVLFDLVSSGNALLEKIDRGDADAVRELASLHREFDTLAEILGVSPGRDWPQERGSAALGPLVEFLLELREEARRAKDFKRADEIRERLTAAGVTVEDRPGGPRWYV
ncbi:MAG: cysteine--tRNA ligase [Actinomycetota bacterium]